MFRGDIGDMVGQFHQLCAAVIRLNDDVFLRLCDVMFKAHDLLEIKRLSKFCGQFHRLVIDRV